MFTDLTRLVKFVVSPSLVTEQDNPVTSDTPEVLAGVDSANFLLTIYTAFWLLFNQVALSVVKELIESNIVARGKGE